MEAIHWLLLANAAVWLGIGGYLAFLGINQRSLAIRARQMEIIQNDD